MTYVIDPSVVLERIRDLSTRANTLKPTFLPIMLLTFGATWRAAAQALGLAAEHENPMRALDMLEAQIVGLERARENVAKTLGVGSSQLNT